MFYIAPTESKRMITNSIREQEAEKKPYGGLFATLFLLLANIAVFAYLNLPTTDPDLINRLALSPHNLMVNKNVYCLITSGFIHRDIYHLFFNCLGIFIFGSIVERKFGFQKTVFIYFAALIISMLFAVVIYLFVLDENVVLIGASGALMGLISTAMLSDPFLITYETLLPIPVMIKGWMFIYADMKGFLGGETDGVSHLAHLLGFLSIAIIVYFMDSRDKKIFLNGLLINIFSFAAFLLAMRYFDGTELVGKLKEHL